MSAADERGCFIVFEGGDGTGKSTQVRLLAETLDALVTREPGGTAIGERLRELWLDANSSAMVDRCEALVIAAARAQHVAEVIRPALESGRHVVSDRFAHSSIAYQGHGRGLAPEEVQRINDWAIEGLWPDLVILIEVPDDIARQRLGQQLDRVESVGDGFHTRVREAFEAFADADPDRWVRIDGTGSIDQVALRVRAAVRERLSL
ncbi:MAG: dTMP kinase [Acidimicrobiia bacterium]